MAECVINGQTQEPFFCTVYKYYLFCLQFLYINKYHGPQKGEK